MHPLFIFFVVFFHFSSCTLSDFIVMKETHVNNICEAVRIYYSSDEFVTSCQRFWACDDDLQSTIENDGGSFDCVGGFGDEEWCGGCYNDESKVSFDRTTIRYAPSTNPMGDKISKFACFANTLTSVYKKNAESDIEQTWQYIGSPNGAFSIFPGHSLLTAQKNEQDSCKRAMYTQNTCPAYDPRIRPWYIAAASGPKDVILVLDKSGSMGKKDRLDLTKEAAKTVIDGLSAYDRVGVVSFSTSASSCVGDALLHGTAVNKDVLKTCVDALDDRGETSFEDGFRAAFNILQARESYAATCHTVILFLTDGEITLGLEGEEFLEFVDKQNNPDMDAKIFTFSMGEDADVLIPQKLACAHKGVWMPIADLNGDDLREKMAGYYNYFINSNHTRGVTWSEKYFDFSGLGWMTTAAQGCFSEDGHLFGVAGVDVLVTEFSDYGDFETAVMPVLEERSKVCYDIQLTARELEGLRKYDKCNDSTNVWEGVGGTLAIIFGIVGVVGICFCIFMCGALLCKAGE